jgi:hypothetical protein
MRVIHEYRFPKNLQGLEDLEGFNQKGRKKSGDEAGFGE